MTTLAQRISNELTPLALEDQEIVLQEVRERLQDLRAKKVYEAVKSGSMETHDSSEVMNQLKKKYAL